jgi:hypothetical protein
LLVGEAWTGIANDRLLSKNVGLMTQPWLILVRAVSKAPKIRFSERQIRVSARPINEYWNTCDAVAGASQNAMSQPLRNGV